MLKIVSHAQIWPHTPKWAFRVIVRIAVFRYVSRDAKNCVTNSNLTTVSKVRKSGLIIGPNAQCRVHLHELISELNSWESVDVKNGLTCSDQPTETRDSLQTENSWKAPQKRLASMRSDQPQTRRVASTDPPEQLCFWGRGCRKPFKLWVPWVPIGLG